MVRLWNVAAWININDVTDFTHQTPDIELEKIVTNINLFVIFLASKYIFGLYD
jgi:hypothetical protein